MKAAVPDRLSDFSTFFPASELRNGGGRTGKVAFILLEAPGIFISGAMRGRRRFGDLAGSQDIFFRPAPIQDNQFRRSPDLFHFSSDMTLTIRYHEEQTKSRNSCWPPSLRQKVDTRGYQVEDRCGHNRPGQSIPPFQTAQKSRIPIAVFDEPPEPLQKAPGA